MNFILNQSGVDVNVDVKSIREGWKAFPFCSMMEKGKDAEAVSLPFLFV